jgi:hypothetical protein
MLEMDEMEESRSAEESEGLLRMLRRDWIDFTISSVSCSIKD